MVKLTSRDLAEDEDPLHVIKAEIDRYTPVQVPGLPRFVGGAVGYLSYDVVRYFERLPETAEEELDVPEAAFMLPDTLIIFDHVKHQLIVLADAHNTGDPDTAYNEAIRRIDRIVVALGNPLPNVPFGGQASDVPLKSNVEQSVYEANVRKAKEYIKDGDAFQVVLSQRFSRETTASPLMIYRALRALESISLYVFTAI